MYFLRSCIYLKGLVGKSISSEPSIGTSEGCDNLDCIEGSASPGNTLIATGFPVPRVSPLNALEDSGEI